MNTYEQIKKIRNEVLYPSNKNNLWKSEVTFKEMLQLLGKTNRIIELSTTGMLFEEFEDSEQIKLLTIFDTTKLFKDQNEEVLKKILEIIKIVKK
jgi:hypothetical protein